MILEIKILITEPLQTYCKKVIVPLYIPVYLVTASQPRNRSCSKKNTFRFHRFYGLYFEDFVVITN
jgi:hypothetical protein